MYQKNSFFNPQKISKKTQKWQFWFDQIYNSPRLFSCFSNIRWWFQIVVHLCFTYTCMFAIPFTVQHFAYESQHQTRYTVRSTWIKWVQMFFCSPRSLRKWLPNLTCAIFFQMGRKNNHQLEKNETHLQRQLKQNDTPRQPEEELVTKMGGKMSSLPGWFPS